MGEHDPTPWKTDDWYGVVAANKEAVCSNGRSGNDREWIETGKANMAFIVTAVNAHEDLVKALEKIKGHTDPDSIEENYRADDREGCLDCVFTIARAALNKLRETKTEAK